METTHVRREILLAARSANTHCTHTAVSLPHFAPEFFTFCFKILSPSNIYAAWRVGLGRFREYPSSVTPDELIAVSGLTATNKVGVIVGAVIGAILLLLLLLLLLWLLCCCCRKRRYEKEVANEIRYSGEADARATPASAGE